MRTKLPKRTTILETWESVYQQYWNSGLWRPRIDIAQVFTDGKRYAVLEHRKARPMGPYSSLSEAAQNHRLLTVFGSTKEVVCRRVETRKLAKLLTPSELRVGFRLSINGEYYVLTPARIFGRCHKQQGTLVSNTENAALGW
jgi:hypothetical protein